MRSKECSLCGRRYTASHRSDFCSSACEQIARQYYEGLRLVGGIPDTTVRKKKIKNDSR